MATLPLFKGSSLWRVTSPSLDPRKNWYILTKDICGTRPTDLAKSEIFRRFQDEIQSVSARELLPAKSSNSSKFNRMPSTLYVASTFGLCAGLLRRKEILPDGLICSPVFESVVSMLNSVASRILVLAGISVQGNSQLLTPNWRKGKLKFTPLIWSYNLSKLELAIWRVTWIQVSIRRPLQSLYLRVVPRHHVRHRLPAVPSRKPRTVLTLEQQQKREECRRNAGR